MVAPLVWSPGREWRPGEDFSDTGLTPGVQPFSNPPSDGGVGRCARIPTLNLLSKISRRRIDVGLPFCVLEREWYSCVRVAM